MRPTTIGKEDIILATLRVVRERGLASTTTRAIAAAVPCSEGSLYVHFGDRNKLIVAAVRTVVGSFSSSLAGLAGRVGEGTVEKNVERVLSLAFDFYKTSMPVLAGAVSEPAVLKALQEELSGLGRGPRQSQSALEGYLRAEQVLGRILPGVDTAAAASIVMCALFGRAFEEAFTGKPSKVTAKTFYRGLMGDWISRFGGKSEA